MHTPLISAALALALAGCAGTPNPTPGGENCVLPVERTVEYGGQPFKKVECQAWEFGPSREQRERWNRDHGGEGGAK